MRPGWLLEFGLTDYAAAWELQRGLVALRQGGHVPDTLILLEHQPVITIGRRSARDHLLVPRSALEARGFGVYDVERGGSVTYHGPGQLVGYPILDLAALDEDVVRYMRLLEETILRTLAQFGIAGTRDRAFPGAWVAGEKLAAVGVAVKRRVTMHGFALNVDPDLSHFEVINPCGLGRPVTSMAKVLGHPVPMGDVRRAYVKAFEDVFGVALTVQPARAG